MTEAGEVMGWLDCVSAGAAIGGGYDGNIEAIEHGNVPLRVRIATGVVGALRADVKLSRCFCRTRAFDGDKKTR